VLGTPQGQEVSSHMSDANRDPRVALYGLLESIEACKEPARAAEEAQDRELADFLRKVQAAEIEGEARKLLARRLARGG
jgi:hypothetical protein